MVDDDGDQSMGALRASVAVRRDRGASVYESNNHER